MQGDVHEHLIVSKAIDQVFRIQVWIPPGYSSRSDPVAVVYATDGNELFAGYAALAGLLQEQRETAPFILVGIGYENASAADLLRDRDFYAHSVRQLYA